MDQLPDTRPENPETSSALATFTGEEECNSSAAGLQDQAAVGRLDYVDSTVEELENGPCGRVGQPRVPRKTFKSCEFCAKRKRRCDGDGVNRCSLCIEKNQVECIYRQKPPSKAKPRPATQQQQIRASGIISTKRPPEPFSFSGGDFLPVPAPGTIKPRLLPLKRCRLSASPATGLLGMQENGFLNEYFGCLGLLPLATESTVREAMVKLMMENAAQAQQLQAQQQLQHTALSFFGFGFTRDQAASTMVDVDRREDKCEGGDLLPSPLLEGGDPSKCIMWCAIALGALVLGVPVAKVTHYVQLARDSLAKCFDGGTMETARAYVVMAFLHKFIGDEDRNRKYLSFATSIIADLPAERAPKEVETMLLTADNSRYSRDLETLESKDELDAYCENVLVLPFPEQIVHKSDLCKIFLATDRRLEQSFIEDMRAQGVSVGDTGGGGAEENHGMDGNTRRIPRSSREICESRAGVTTPAHTLDLSARDSCATPHIPPAGIATRRFIREFMPGLSRVSRVAEGSGATTGIGGLFYHGNIAYMKVVQGEPLDSFANLLRCAEVLQRYPGICRIRPHLTHCILAASAIASRPLYDQVRAVYNAFLLPGYIPTPPFEEWTSIVDICDNIFCRSVQTEIRDVDCEWNGGDASISTDACTTSFRSSCSADSHGSVTNRKMAHLQSPPPAPEVSALHTGKPLISETTSSTLTTRTDLSPAVPATQFVADSEISPRRRSPSGADVDAAAGDTGMKEAEAAITPLPVTSRAPASPTSSATFPARSSTVDAYLGGSLTNVLASPTSAAAAADKNVASGFDIMMPELPVETCGTAEETDCGAVSAAQASVQASSPSIQDLVLFDDMGVDDAASNLRLTEEDLMDAADFLLCEGLFEGEAVQERVGNVAQNV